MYTRQSQLSIEHQSFYSSYNVERCPNCKVVFSGTHNCKIACLYCHDYHFKKDLIENMCPVMYPYAKEEQQKHSFTCKCCKGEGSYTQEVQKVKYESKKNYQQRLKDWSETINSEKGLLIPKPKRRIFDKQKKIKEAQCSDCLGRGKILRMINCCREGCRNCNWEKSKINPLWKEYRRQPTKNQKLFSCSICLMEVQVQAKKYTLDCKHEFHPDCIFKWMKNKRSCPVCRRVDIYMQQKQFESNQQEERGQAPRFHNNGSISNIDESEEDSIMSY